MNDLSPDLNADPAPDARLSRRALLRVAAGLAGALAFGLEASPARAGGTAPNGSKEDASCALAFWDGARLLDPARMPGDRALAGTSIRLTLHSRPAGGHPALHALIAQFPVSAGEATQWTSFTAWAASAHDGGRGISFTLPIHPTEGLRLSVEQGAGPLGAGQTTECRLSVTGSGPVLRAGTYLLAPAGTDWTGFALADGEHLTMRGGQPAGFDHLVLTVAPA